MTQETCVNRTWTSLAFALMAIASLSGCATRKEKLLPHGDTTMLDVWNQNAAGGVGNTRPSRVLLDARSSLRRSLSSADREAAAADNATYTRDAEREVDRLFVRLPNPDLVMYIFPHLTGRHPVPVPGYSTVFPLYEHVQYALPGERTEDY